MADPFCDRLGSKNDSTDLCGCQRNPWVYIHFIDHSDCIWSDYSDFNTDLEEEADVNEEGNEDCSAVL